MPDPEHFTPKSTAIKRAEYLDGSLRVHLQSGISYMYRNVPAATWEAFKKAESAGKFFAKHIVPNHTSKKGKS